MNESDITEIVQNLDAIRETIYCLGVVLCFLVGGIFGRGPR